MANVISTTTQGMQAAATKIDSTITDFTGQLKTVNQSMLALQSTWTGAASNNFGGAMNNWESGFTRVINALIGLNEAMGVNTKLYTEQEEAAVDTAKDFATGPGLPDF